MSEFFTFFEGSWNVNMLTVDCSHQGFGKMWKNLNGDHLVRTFHSIYLRRAWG